MKLYCGKTTCKYNKDGLCDKPLVRSRLKSCLWYKKPEKKAKDNV